MAAMIVVFIIELAVACIIYFMLRKILPRKSLLILALVACVAGLLAGWIAGYRITGNTLLRDYVDSADVQQRELTGAGLSDEQSMVIMKDLLETPGFYLKAYVRAAIYAWPPIFLVFWIITRFSQIWKSNETREL